MPPPSFTPPKAKIITRVSAKGVAMVRISAAGVTQGNKKIFPGDIEYFFHDKFLSVAQGAAR